MMPKPIKQKKLYEQVIAEILQLINSGQLQDGDRLPTEKQIAHEMHVSKTVVREALSAMESMGYTRTKKGDGTYVAAMTLESLILPISIVLYQDENVIKNILEFRSIIEPQFSALAAQRISDDQIEELKKIQDSMQREIDQGGIADKEDLQFHTLLAKASGNSVLFCLYEMCQSVVDQTITAIAKWPGQPQRGYQEHEKITQAICSRDSAMAEKMMQEHMDHLARIYRSHTSVHMESDFVSAG
jgi:GntR family transcriptional repressor for pyruvate dehydrogenase complex